MHRLQLHKTCQRWEGISKLWAKRCSTVRQSWQHFTNCLCARMPTSAMSQLHSPCSWHVENGHCQSDSVGTHGDVTAPALCTHLEPHTSCPVSPTSSTAAPGRDKTAPHVLCSVLCSSSSSSLTQPSQHHAITCHCRAGGEPMPSVRENKHKWDTASLAKRPSPELDRQPRRKGSQRATAQMIPSEITEKHSLL